MNLFPYEPTLERASELFQSDLERLKQRKHSQQSGTVPRDYVVQTPGTAELYFTLAWNAALSRRRTQRRPTTKWLRYPRHVAAIRNICKAASAEPRAPAMSRSGTTANWTI